MKLWRQASQTSPSHCFSMFALVLAANTQHQGVHWLTTSWTLLAWLPREIWTFACTYAELSSLGIFYFIWRSLNLRSSTIMPSLHEESWGYGRFTTQYLFVTQDPTLSPATPSTLATPPQPPFTLKPEPQPRRRNLQSARWAISFLVVWGTNGSTKLIKIDEASSTTTLIRAVRNFHPDTPQRKMRKGNQTNWLRERGRERERER